MDYIFTKFRLPDGSVDPNLVAADIKSIGSVGAGGVQFNNDFAVNTRDLKLRSEMPGGLTKI